MQNTFNTLEDFNRALAKTIEESFEHDRNMIVTATEQTVLKTNGPHTGICIKKDGSNIAPIVYTDGEYTRFQEGTPYDVIAEDLCKIISNALDQEISLPDFTPEEAKKHITLNLVNTERNQELLKTVPHFEVGDCSAIPRWVVDDGMSFVMKNEMAAHCQLTPDEVLQIGMKNIADTEFKIDSLTNVLRSIYTKQGMGAEEAAEIFLEDDSIPKILVLTSDNGIQGARAILNEKVLEQIHEEFGEDFIILPSSVHEVLCVSSSGNDPETLKATVREVNSTVVSTDEFLSDNPMICDGHKVRLLIEQPKVEPPKFDEPKVRYAGFKM